MPTIPIRILIPGNVNNEHLSLVKIMITIGHLDFVSFLVTYALLDNKLIIISLVNSLLLADEVTALFMGTLVKRVLLFLNFTSDNNGAAVALA